LAGDLNAKQTTINPNFAAVVVELLRRAGVKEGDTVAIGCSGSFPALNLAVYAAVETLKVKPIVILSASSSQWGANQPELMWIDMERILSEQGVISFRAVAASFGGAGDRGEGLSPEGKDLIEKAIRRNHIPLLKADSFERSVQRRMELYRKHAGRNPIRAYVNVGAGTVSVGHSLGKRMFQPGLNLRYPAKMKRVDGVMPRFIQEGVPVIHLEEVRTLAEKYELPIAPKTMPDVGQGSIFVARAYHKGIAGAVLGVILAALYGFIRSDIGFRLLRTRSPRNGQGHPEPMV
jgi:poly-gamma-glutamate system protein